MIVRTNLITIDGPVQPPEGLVYSANPRRAEGEDGTAYFIKGSELEIVFAEIAGCALAREVGLPVPEVAACEFGGEVFVGTKKIDVVVRDIEPWLLRAQKVINFNDMFAAIVVDIWLANHDRNIGNVLPRPHEREVEFVFIDFEKSIALHPSPVVASTILEPRKLWPRGLLGDKLRAIRHLYPPMEMIDRIRSTPTQRWSAIINEVVTAIGAPVNWHEDVVNALSKRAGRIQQLAEEVWAIN
jgi:hypothetical protein